MSDLERLRADYAKLAPSDRAFAYSLLNHADERGHLSPRQMNWVSRLLERVQRPPAQLVKFDASPIVALFEKASATLKFPKIVVEAAGREMRLSIAGSKSRTPGAIMVSSPEKSFEARTFFGRVSSDGIFEPSDRLPPETATAVAAALQALAEDPEEAARAYGRRTGNCCFCSLPLTDKRSIEVGYGPTCAEHFGLTWGSRGASSGRLNLLRARSPAFATQCGRKT